jgi:hypothetical protein
MRNIFGYFFTAAALISLVLYILCGGALLNWDIPIITSEFCNTFFSFFGCNKECLQSLMPLLFVAFVITGILGFAFFLGFKRKERKDKSD